MDSNRKCLLHKDHADESWLLHLLSYLQTFEYGINVRDKIKADFDMEVMFSEGR